jgi:predicted aspartyl protease
MIQGYFKGNIPLVNVLVAWGRATQAPAVVLDTGFTGDLQITPQLAKELDINAKIVTKMQMADGSIVNVKMAFAFVVMEGVKKYVEVLISEGSSLIGINLLSSFQYKAIIDCKYKTVILEKS